MSDDWSKAEVQAAVSEYFEMLAAESRGEQYNKAEHNRRLRAVLHGRSKGAVELKHQNISAVLRDLGRKWIRGYKPREHYQGLLLEVVRARVAKATRAKRTLGNNTS